MAQTNNLLIFISVRPDRITIFTQEKSNKK